MIKINSWLIQKNLLKATKNEYQRVVKENKQLREFIITNKKRRIQTTKNNYEKTKTTKI